MKIKTLFKREPPINGGNTFEMEKILTAKEDSINQYLNQNLESGFIVNQYNYWELLQFQADYFASTLRITFKDNKIDPKIYLLFRCNFLYGNVGLLKKGEDLIPIVESSHHIDASGNLIKITGYSAYEVATTTGTLTENEKKFKTKYVIRKQDMENYARLHVPSYGFGAIVRWYKFVLMQEALLKKLYTYSFLLTKKITYNVNDIGAANIEIKRFFSDDYPFLVNLYPSIPNGNKFSADSVGNGAASEEIFYYYERWLKIYYEMLGRRLNVDRKGERNITSEVDASQENFTILENEMKINKINFIKDVEKLIGKSCEILNEETSNNNGENREVAEGNRSKNTPEGNGEEVKDEV